MPRQSQLWASDAFRHSLECASPWLFDQAWRKINYYSQTLSASPASIQQFDRVEHLQERGISVLEMDVGSRIRLLADYHGGRLTLLRLGDKPIVPGYSSSLRRSDLASSKPMKPYAPPAAQMAPGGFFATEARPSPKKYDVEDDVSWLYFLDDQQWEATEQILEAVGTATVLNTRRFFVIGPPGTGKTAILLNLWVRSRPKRIRAGLHVSDSLAKYCEMCGLTMQGRRWSPTYRGKPWDLLLVDDPAFVTSIDQALDGAFGKARVVVVAFDPLQLRGEVNDAIFNRTVKRHGVEVIRLNECYRQREVLGAAAKRTLDVLAKSSAFFVKEKTDAYHAERRELFSWANDIRFVLPGGSERVVTGVTRAKAEAEVSRIKSLPLWQHAPGVLLAVAPDCAGAHWPWTRWMAGARHAMVTLDDIETIKGLDFQHVVLVMGEARFDQASKGFKGVSRAVYEQLKLLRIPFTRARDSMTVLVVKDYLASDPKLASAKAKAAAPGWGTPYQ